MRFTRLMFVFGVLFSAANAQNPAGRGGGGGRGAAPQTMTLMTTAWPDGGMIPARYTQAGPELSPAIQWSGAPQGTAASC